MLMKFLPPTDSYLQFLESRRAFLNFSVSQYLKCRWYAKFAINGEFAFETAPGLVYLFDKGEKTDYEGFWVPYAIVRNHLLFLFSSRYQDGVILAKRKEQMAILPFFSGEEFAQMISDENFEVFHYILTDNADLLAEEIRSLHFEKDFWRNFIAIGYNELQIEAPIPNQIPISTFSKNLASLLWKGDEEKWIAFYSPYEKNEVYERPASGWPLEGVSEPCSEMMREIFPDLMKCLVNLN